MLTEAEDYAEAKRVLAADCELPPRASVTDCVRLLIAQRNRARSGQAHWREQVMAVADADLRAATERGK